MSHGPLPTSCGPHRNRFLEVQTEIRDRMTSDKRTLLTEATASGNWNLLFVGGCTDTLVDLVAGGNPHEDAQRVHEQMECFSYSRALNCFCNGQTILWEGNECRCQEGYVVSDGGFF